MQNIPEGSRRPLGLVIVCGLALLAAACGPADRPTTRGEAGTEPSPDRQLEEGAVIAAHRSLIRAFEQRDVDAVTALLESRPDLLIFHPFVENRFDGYDEVREGLGRMFQRLSSLEWTEVHQAIQIEGNVAWITSQVLVQSPDLESPFVGRGTEIWVKRRGDWRLNHGHWSEHASLVRGG